MRKVGAITGSGLATIIVLSLSICALPNKINDHLSVVTVAQFPDIQTPEVLFVPESARTVRYAKILRRVAFSADQTGCHLSSAYPLASSISLASVQPKRPTRLMIHVTRREVLQI